MINFVQWICHIYYYSLDSELDFYEAAVSNPVNLMKKWLVTSASILTSVSGEDRFVVQFETSPKMPIFFAVLFL